MSTKTCPYQWRHKKKYYCLNIGRDKNGYQEVFFIFLHENMRVVGWCKGVVYLKSPGHSTDMAYSLARPAILVAG